MRARALQLTRGSKDCSADLCQAYERLELCDLSGGGLADLDPGFDVAVAVDVLSPQQLRVALGELHRLLVEGGVLLLTVEARGRDEVPFSMIAGPARAWHELELQYCLQRSAFQGLRIRRMDSEDGGQRFLVMAVRRALN